MKKILYKIGLFITALLLSSSVAFSYDVSKEYHKTYSVDKDYILGLNNMYGDIIVETNDGNSVEIDVFVELSSKKQELAQEMLSLINVDFVEEGKKIVVKTSIKDNNTIWKIRNKSFNIRYVVSMPSWLNLSVVNKYGDTKINRLDGAFNADLKYGNLNISELTRGNDNSVAQIKSSHGSVNIDKANWVYLNVSYSSSVVIGSAQAIALYSRYSDITVDTYINSMVINSKYDKYSLKDVSNLVIDASYTDINIDNILKKFNIDCKYGSVDVNKISAEFSELIVDSDYTDFELGIDPNSHYQLDANLSYGDLKIDRSMYSNLTFIDSNNKVDVSGEYNATSSKPISVVKLRSSYGDIELD